jgi:hypothetical protein
MTAAGRECAWSLCVDAATARLADVRRFVEVVAGEALLDPERAFDCKVAVSEARRL